MNHRKDNDMKETVLVLLNRAIDINKQAFKRKRKEKILIEAEVVDDAKQN